MILFPMDMLKRVLGEISVGDELNLEEYLDFLLKKYKEVENNNLAQIVYSNIGGDRFFGLDYVDASGSRRIDMKELRTEAQKLARYFRDNGVGKGDRVGVLLPKCPPLIITALALWQLGAVYVPLFTAFGTDAISFRAIDSEAKFIVTNMANEGKVGDDVRASSKVMVVDSDTYDRGVVLGDALKSEALDEFVSISPNDYIVIIYTSGTTGSPKGVPVPLWAVAALESYMTLGIGLRPTDTYWNMADPGWAYGLYYGVVAPLAMGFGILFLNIPFDPNRVEEVWREHRITNFAGAPTAYRAMRMAIGNRKVESFLERMSSAGEPLNPEVIEWVHNSLGVEIRDHYGQTENGMMINNPFDPRLALPVQPGSMGKAALGFRAVLVDGNFNELGDGVDGEVAIDTSASPLFWFPNYYRNEEKSKERFSPDMRYYLTGDVASRNSDGYFYFSGRSDDVISTAGYRVGPFEVESAIMTHPAVAECAVIGVPDELRGEAICAYVVLRNGLEGSEDLAEEIRQVVRDRMSKTSYPRYVRFVETLPKTPSGKIQRFLLRREEAN